MALDILAARKAGYSDTEIADYLRKNGEPAIPVQSAPKPDMTPRREMAPEERSGIESAVVSGPSSGLTPVTDAFETPTIPDAAFVKPTQADRRLEVMGITTPQTRQTLTQARDNILQGIKPAPALTVAGLEQSAGGAMRIIGEHVFDNGSKDNAWTRKGTELYNEGQAVQEQVDKELPVEDNSPGYHLRNVGVSLGTQVPSMALGLATGGAALPLAVMGLQTGTQKYGEYRKDGVDPGKALAGAIGQGVVEAGTELLPTMTLFHKGAGPVAKMLESRLSPAVKTVVGDLSKPMAKFLEFFGEEQVGELAATLLQDGIDMKLNRPDMTWDDIYKDLKDTWIQTAISAPIQSGGVHVVHGVLSRAAEATNPAARGFDSITGNVDLVANPLPQITAEQVARSARLAGIMVQDTPEAQAQRLAAIEARKQAQPGVPAETITQEGNNAIQTEVPQSNETEQVPQSVEPQQPIDGGTSQEGSQSGKVGPVTDTTPPAGAGEILADGQEPIDDQVAAERGNTGTDEVQPAVSRLEGTTTAAVENGELEKLQQRKANLEKAIFKEDGTQKKNVSKRMLDNYKALTENIRQLTQEVTQNGNLSQVQQEGSQGQAQVPDVRGEDVGGVPALTLPQVKDALAASGFSPEAQDKVHKHLEDVVAYGNELLAKAGKEPDTNPVFGKQDIQDAIDAVIHGGVSDESNNQAAVPQEQASRQDVSQPRSLPVVQEQPGASGPTAQNGGAGATTRAILQSLAKPKNKSASLVVTLREQHGKDILNQMVRDKLIAFPGRGVAEITKEGAQWLKDNPEPLSPQEVKTLERIDKKRNRSQAEAAQQRASGIHFTPDPVRVMDTYGRYHYVDRGELAQGKNNVLRRYNAKGERLTGEKNAIHRANIVDTNDAEAVAMAKRAKRLSDLEKKAEKGRLTKSELSEAKELQKQVVEDFDKKFSPENASNGEVADHIVDSNKKIDESAKETQTEEPFIAKEEKKGNDNSGDKNKTFTQDAYERAKARMKSKLSQLNVGFDPEMLQDGITVAGYHLEKGTRKFADYAKAMIADFGGSIKPYLKAFYNGVRDLPGIDHITREMDNYDAVSKHDLDKQDSVIPRLTDIGKQLVDARVKGNSSEREVVVADKATALKAFDQTAKNYDDPQRLLFRAYYLDDEQRERGKSGNVPYNSESPHEYKGQPVDASWWTTSWEGVSQQIAAIKSASGKEIKIVALPVDKIGEEVYLQNIDPAGMLHELFVGIPGEVSRSDTETMTVGKNGEMVKEATNGIHGGVQQANDQERDIQEAGRQPDTGSAVQDDHGGTGTGAGVQEPDARGTEGSAAEASSGATGVADDGLTVTFNQVKSGIELRFASKPDPQIIQRIKNNGFRWFSREKLWYAKDGTLRRQFAEKLQAELGKTPPLQSNAASSKLVNEEKQKEGGNPDVNPENNGRHDAGNEPAGGESVRAGRNEAASGSEGGTAAGSGDRTAEHVAEQQPEKVQKPERSGAAPTDAEKPRSGAEESEGDGRGSVLESYPAEREDGDVRAPTHVVGTGDNFTITNELDFTGVGQKTKFRNNVDAIKTLRLLEKEGRPATPGEQAILARYVGWGGMPQAFDAKKQDWAKEHAELKEFLSSEEYQTAVSSTRNAHYTAAEVVTAIWQGVQRLGFVRGSILEPSVGTGNFFGLMPREVRAQSKLQGIEFDHITGSIAKYLYPKARINVTGFQDLKLQPNSYDLAIGNPPFGAESLYDKDHPAISKFKIHGFFFAKSLESVRPGGVLAMVVSKGLLDAGDATGTKQRQWLAERAKLLGAIRLPDSAFKANAGTDVTTDIVFLQKLQPGEEGNAEKWSEAGEISDRETGSPIRINRYFIDNPGMMLGEMTLKGKMFRGGAETLTARPGGNLTELLNKAIATLPEGVIATGARTTENLEQTAREGLTKVHEVRPYNFFMEGDALYQRMPDLNGEATAASINLDGKSLERVKGMLAIRDTVRRQLRLESSPQAGKREIESNRKRLNTLYDNFVKQNGHLSNQTNKRLFKDDADSPLILSLEKNFDKGVSREVAKKNGIAAKEPAAAKADIFTRRVLTPSAEVTSVKSADEALLASINERGGIDFAYMKDLYGKNFDEIKTELGDSIYDDPRLGWQHRDAYLSGNVKAKLAEAIRAVSEDPRYQRNVDALQAVQPKDIPVADIFVAPHSYWVPENVFAQFARETFEGSMSGGYQRSIGRFNVRFTSGNATLNEGKYGTKKMPATEIMAALMGNKQIAVYDSVDDGHGGRKQVLNPSDTAAAQGKADELTEAFQDWLWTDADRRQKLGRTYNDAFNTTLDRKYDGAHLTLPGISSTIDLRPHQNNGVYRVLQTGVILFDHVVGAGKTFAIAASAMEQRRLGMARKPMITVPNHLVEQWAKEFKQLYPSANILAATRKDFEKNNRRLLFSKIATGDWDMVIVAHSSFKFIPVPQAIEQEILGEQLRELTQAIEEAKREKGARFTIKDLERTKIKIEEKLKKLADAPKDDLLDFSELGVDALYVDEAHEFKNLFYTTTMQNVAGLGNQSGSSRAFDMFVKTQYLMRRNGGKGVFFATGTPVSNSLAEVFHMQRFLQYDELKARGLHNFDAWASTFGQATSDWEQDAGGRFRQKTRFRKLVNLPELKQLWGEVADTVTRADLMRDAEAQGKRFPLPKIEGGKPKNVVVERSPEQAKYIGIPREVKDENGDVVIDQENGQPKIEYDPGTIIYRMEHWAEAVKAGNTREIPLVITGDARKAGLDFRLIDESSPDFKGSKVNTAVNEIYDIWKENDRRKGTQLVFIDLSTPKKHKGKTLEKMAEKVPTYFIKKNGGIEHVQGKPMQLSAMPEAEFFSVSVGKGSSRRFVVYEKQSGLHVGDGPTLQEAKDFTNSRLANIDKDKFLENVSNKAIPQEQVDDYIERWEEAKAKEEETGSDDEKAPEQEISLDEILADSGSSNFSVYDDIKEKLVKMGIPAHQVVFIHDYDTDLQKADLFNKMNNGDVRVLLGSTAKMGAGTNVQRKLVALHHLDAPWKPSDLEQREGRIIRQGNEFYEQDPDGFEIKLRRYATKQTYDSRMWEIIETKAKAIELFKSGGKDVREVEDVSSESSNAAEIKASSAGNPLMLEDLQLKNEIKKLEAQEKAWKRSRYDQEDLVKKVESQTAYPYVRKAELEGLREGIKAADHKHLGLQLGGTTYQTNKDFDAEKMFTPLKEALDESNRNGLKPVEVGKYRGAAILAKSSFGELRLTLAVKGVDIGATSYGAKDNFSAGGFVTRLDNIVDGIPDEIEKANERIAKLEREAAAAKEELTQEFKGADKLKGLKDQHKKVVDALRRGKTSVDDATVEPKFSLGETSTGITKADAAAAIATLTENWKNAPQIEVVQSAKDLPAALSQEIASMGAEGAVRGLFENGRAYLVADNLWSGEEAVQVLLHEVVGHYGLRGMLGKEFDAVLRQVITIYGKKGLQRIAEDYGFDLTDSEDRLTAAEEKLAELAESGEKPGLVARVVAMVKDWLRRMGLNVKWTEADIRALIAKAQGWVERGKTGKPTIYDGSKFMVAWHGSTDRIGTGEGTQAYGYGLYFAGNKDVAEWYKSRLGGDSVEDITAAKQYLKDKGISNDPEEDYGYSNGRDYVTLAVEHGFQPQNKGRLYQVELAPAEDEYLLWDKPLSEQSEKVKGILNDAWLAHPEAHSKQLGAEIYGHAVDEMEFSGKHEENNWKAASEYLHSLGIRGIKYLDGSSRNKGEGHYNYVIFNDADVETKAKFSLRKNRTGDAAADAFLDKIGAKPKPFKDRLAEVTDRIALKTEQGLFDKFASLKELDKLAGVTGPDDSAYIAARMSTSLSDVIFAMLKHGHPVWRDGGSAVQGKGLAEIFKPVSGDLNLFLGWMVAERAQKLMNEGRERYFTQEEINAGKSLKTPENAARWELVRREYVQYKKRVLDFAQAAGVINPDARAIWDHEEYVPFYRIVEAKVKGPGKKKGLASQNSGIRTLTGADERLGDIFENIVRNFTQLTDAAIKNHATELAVQKAEDIGAATKALLDWKAATIDKEQLLSKMGEIIAENPEEVDLFFSQQDKEDFLTLFHPAKPQGKTIIHVLRDGKPVYYDIHDDILLRSLTSINDQVWGGPAMNAMRWVKRLLTVGVTSAPDFMLRNFVRDTIHTWVISRNKFAPVLSSLQGAVKVWGHDQDIIQLMAAGGAFHGGFAYGNDPAAAKLMVEKLLKKKGIDAATVLNTPKKLWEFWQEIGGSMENAARVQTYRNTLDKTGSHLQAAFDAKDLMDFSMRGDFAAIQFLTQTVPFLGARIQGLQRLGKGAMENPRAFMVKGGIIALASVLLYLYNRDDDRFKELEEFDKDNYFHFFIAGKHYRLPKPFEVGAVFGTIPERLTELAIEKGHDGKLFAERMLAMLTQTFAVGLPQIMNEPMQQWANKDFFTDRPIVGKTEEGLLPAEQRDVHTGATATEIGRTINVSPKRIEHAINGYFGTLGTYVMGASDIITRRLADYPNQPTMKLNEMPVLKSFYRGEGPANNTKFTTSFYELLNEVDQTAKTIDQYRKTGDDERADKLIEKELPKLQNRGMLHQAQRQLAGINRKMKAIHLDRDMNSDEKRAAIDDLQTRKNEITKSVMEQTRAPAD